MPGGGKMSVEIEVTSKWCRGGRFPVWWDLFPRHKEKSGLIFATDIPCLTALIYYRHHHLQFHNLKLLLRLAGGTFKNIYAIAQSAAGD